MQVALIGMSARSVYFYYFCAPILMLFFLLCVVIFIRSFSYYIATKALSVPFYQIPFKTMGYDFCGEMNDGVWEVSVTKTHSLNG
jgi:hypothetical protein